MASMRQITTAIQRSDLTDEELAGISAVILKKRQAQQLAASRTLQIGDVVQLTRIKPKYLQGETGTLIERRPGGKLAIKLDHPAGRYGGTVIVHPTCVEALDV